MSKLAIRFRRSDVDQMFVNRCLEGDWAAFAFLVDKYKQVVHAYAYHRANDYQGARLYNLGVFLNDVN